MSPRPDHAQSVRACRGRATPLLPGHHRRRGVVLVVILGLLAILALLGVSFALLAGSEEQAARHYHNAARRQQPAMEPQEILLEAIGQLVADTANPMSAIRGHSLLRDMYGNDNDLWDEQGRPFPDGQIQEWERYQRAFNGPGEKGPDGIPNTPDDTDVNYVFNGRIPEGDPNNNPAVPPEGGGFDEDYDYWDIQNMFLAGPGIPSFRRPGLETPADWTSTANQPGRGKRLILRPRPVEHPQFPTLDLNNDGIPENDVDNDGDGVRDSIWVDIGLPVMTSVDGRRFKPLVAYLVRDLDGRLNLNVHGQLNADKLDANGSMVFPNPGDGQLDSHADVATTAHTGMNTPPLVGLGSGYSVAEVNLQNLFLPDPIFFSTVYQGGIFSPFEYRWLLEGRLLLGGRPVLGRWGELTVLLNGGAPRPGFTGVDDDLGVVPGLVAGDRLVGGRWTPYARPTGGTDPTRVSPSWLLFRTPLDADGDGYFWVDNRGRTTFGNWAVPYWGAGSEQVPPIWPPAWAELIERVDESDELNPYDARAAAGSDRADKPFTVEELELLLRFEDVDGHSLAQYGPGPDLRPGIAGQDDDGDGVVDNASELGWPNSDDAAGRLPLLARSLFDERPSGRGIARQRRESLTTESWDLISFSQPPVVVPTPPAFGEQYPPADAPPALRRLAGNGRLFTPPPGSTGGWGAGPLGRNMPPVFQIGLLWSVGADGAPGVRGQDDDGNGVVDDIRELGAPNSDDAQLPAEIARGRRLNLHRHLVMPSADRAGDPYWVRPVASVNDPRCLARDIYLALRLTYPTSDRAKIRRMAQFAVNVVDFMDPDDVMTPFEYDPDLSNGWNVDGALGPPGPGEDPNREVVWGVERPRVVINETLAFETEDDGYQLWFELYNPGLPEATDSNDVVDLARYPQLGHPESRANPVYRVVLAQADTNDATDPITGEPSQNRIISEFAFYPPPNGAVRTDTRIAGGQQLLVGPAGVDPAPVTIPQVDFDTGPNAFNLGPGDADVTTPPRRRLYLQRLAHPGHPLDWGPDGTPYTSDDVNPYITVDALEVKVWSREAVEPDPMDPNAQRTFKSIERVEAYGLRHAEHPQNGNDVNPHTLNNKQNQGPPRNTNDRPIHTAFTFYDRPISTPLELLLVPACQPQWLTTLFTLVADADQIGQLLDFHDPAAAGQEDRAPSPLVTGDWQALDLSRPFLVMGNAGDEDYFFGYLRNFFREVPGRPVPYPGYYRLFELVEVPSQVNGALEVYDNTSGDRRRWRVPGKVNINTVVHPWVFLALFNNHPAALAADLMGTPAPQADASLLWRRFVTSRSGPDNVSGTADDLPVRSYLLGATATQPGNLNPLIYSIQSTLLRSLPATGTPKIPLIYDLRQVPPAGLQPGQRNNSMYSYPAYLFGPLTKLGNVVTTRSHVFAVWITIGFFEVVDEPRPDGQDNDNDGLIDEADELLPRLGKEIGADTGQVVRHRAFFIVDRSRADGWPGPPQTREELLAILKKVVLLSRVIE